MEIMIRPPFCLERHEVLDVSMDQNDRRLIRSVQDQRVVIHQKRP